jgi:DNA-binding transcriptional MerR regulator
MKLPMARTTLLHLEVFSEQCGMHPDLVRRYVVLGLVEPDARQGDALFFAPRQVRRVARMQRLRSDLGLNYNALGLVIDLLERIEQLERTAARGARRPPQD